MQHFSNRPTPRAARMRLPNLALFIAASLPMVLLILLVIGMVFGTSQARAATDESCHGENLVERLAKTDPEALATAKAEAAAIPNGSGRLWKLEKPGAEPSWLFGTMHVTDPRVIKLPEAAETAFQQADTVVIETTDILDPAKAQAALMARPDLTMFTDGKTLTSFLDESEAKLVEEELSRRGIPLALVSRMKPWIIAGMLAMPKCEMESRTDGVEFLDIKIANDAKSEGKTLLGLESVGEQLSAMADLPIEFHVQGLVETIRLADLMPDIMTTMTDLYIDGEIAQIMPVIMASSPETSAEDMDGYAQFEKRIVLMRNHVMAERAAPILGKGNAFIAVGALHLPGEEGLVSLLKQDGYTATRLF